MVVNQTEEDNYEESPKLSPLVWWTRELVSLFLWLGVFTKLFFFDFDVELVNRFAPNYLYVLQYRFLIGLGLVAILWLVLGNKSFGRFVAYALLYPLVWLLWKIPKYVFKNWAVAIAFSPAIYSTVVTFRWSFIWTSFALIAAVATLSSSMYNIVLPSMIMLSAYQLRHLIRRFKFAFRPATVFSHASKIISDLWTSSGGEQVTEYFLSHREHEKGSEEYEKGRSLNLLSYYFLNSALLIAAKSLRNVARSRKLDLYFIGALTHTFVLTVLVFALLYMGLYKINPDSFSIPVDGVSFWHFLGYSFSTILTADLGSLSALSSTAQILSYSQLIAGLLIGAILVFVLLTIVRERHKEDINKVVNELNHSATTLSRTIESEFQLTPNEIEKKLLEENEDSVRLVKKLLTRNN